ncbi:resuscitation-promoting factor [Streptomyces tropicalis]|uniref:Ubiquitin-like domain-containing protein n=1 Tax=Streptomyces tropicalis TaxID=3034234 RepID=A0ABT6AAK6_9ACTN|nr:resuscitation-promoting factor [Streptomyces tropicalis]MDF3301675.1 ubiquitin-like domain-containing protein [Streptomyces tropicalis]
MSDAQYGTYGTRRAGGSPLPVPEPPAYPGVPADLHTAETLAYGVYGGYGGHGGDVLIRDARATGTPGTGVPRDPYGVRATAEDRTAYGPHGLRGPAGGGAPHQGAPYQDAYRPAYERAAGAVLPRQGRGAPRTPAARAARPDPDGTGEAGRRGARRRRARPADRPEVDVRRLLPQALVVAFLAGGTTAFVAQDKAVELTVDGRPRTLHTFADDVSGLLAEEGLRVGSHDVVVPAPGTPLTGGTEVAVHRGRPLRLTLDGELHEVWTTAGTVDGALRELGVRAEGAHLSVSRSQPIGRAGLALDIRTERTVTVMADGRARTLRTNAATVAGAVEEAGVTLRGEDTTSVAQDSFPRDGLTVTVLRISGSREVREEPVPFEERRVADPTLFRGTEVVEQAGRPGVRRVAYALRTVNGVRQRPRRLESELVREPRTQIVKVGTRVHPPSVRGADGLDWRGLAQCESGGRPDAVDPSGTYGGLYQFDTATWHSLGGSGRPQDAPGEEQTYRAKKLYVRQGSSPWPHCGDRLQG